MKYLLVTETFVIVFQILSAIVIPCNGMAPTPALEEATTTNSLTDEKEFVAIFDSNHDYNDSLIYPESAYYQYLKEYYESTALGALQNTSTSNFIVTNVTVLGFIRPSNASIVLTIESARYGVGVDMNIGVSALPSQTLPPESQIQATIVKDLQNILGWLVQHIGAIALSSIPDFCEWPKAIPLCVIKPTFAVFTKKGKTSFDISSDNDIDNMINKLNADGSIHSRVVFIVHGFEAHGDDPWLTQMALALLSIEDDDTIFVTGWDRGADVNPLRFPQAAANTQTVSAAISYVVDSLRGMPTPATYYYCIGHSLGAHVCGQAGRTINPPFNRVSGLDPAGPGFQNCQNIGLSNASANCVDVLHTNGGGLGTTHSLGHVDFYPNCGQDQPSCYGSTDFVCDHSMAHTYFLETIKAVKAGKLPTAQGPCGNTFLNSCQAGAIVQNTCDSDPNAKQPVGYGSVCYDGKTPKCMTTVSNYFGLWYVAVTNTQLYFASWLTCS